MSSFACMMKHQLIIFLPVSILQRRLWPCGLTAQVISSEEQVLLETAGCDEAIKLYIGPSPLIPLIATYSLPLH